MKYEIITFRWACAECGGPLRLSFAQIAEIENDAPAEEYACDRVFCIEGHPVSEELAEEAAMNADQEFSAAMERGFKTAEVWCVPTEQDESPNESPPPEDR